MQQDYEQIFDSKNLNNKEYKFVNLKKIFEENEELKKLPFSCYCNYIPVVYGV